MIWNSISNVIKHCTAHSLSTIVFTENNIMHRF